MKVSQLILSLLVFCFVLSFVYSNSDEVTEVIGYKGPEVNFKQYAGYIQVNETSNRNLFYWFLESQRSPSDDPLVLWLNGGPGCSSLEGFLTEHGYFDIQDDGETVLPNDHSWNRISNMLYIESPAGVGFSYSDNPADYAEPNDDKTASDLYTFLVRFFEKYPQFAKNEFYVTGESYAGHYVVVTVNAIHEGNLAGQNPRINLQGFMVGNGITDSFNDGNSLPYYLWQHLMITDQFFKGAFDACKGDFVRNGNVPACSKYLYEMQNIIVGVNPYNIYDKCRGSPSKILSAVERTVKMNPVTVEGKPVHPLFMMSRRLKVSAPCIDAGPQSKYFSNPKVKASIHAKGDINWEFCSGIINANYDWTYASMIPFYKKLLPHYRAIIYTGDIDIAVNGMGSQATVVQLNRTLEEGWKSFHIAGEPGEIKQVGGFVEKYENLYFVTIRGAGHMTPTDRPEASFTMFQNFLEQKPFH